MDARQEKRNQLLYAVADHILDHGLLDASLRPMARTAGTSDRMLIYHFGSREQLIETVLEHLTDRVKESLDLALPAMPFKDRPTAIASIMNLLRTPEFRRFNAVWLEILAKAASGKETYRKTARRIMVVFADWLEQRVPKGEEDRRAAAWTLLAQIEGLVVMDAAGQSERAFGFEEQQSI
ncbi:MAG: TetR/AcrR family transcriptional regulator [Pseudomonadota bacterium]